MLATNFWSRFLFQKAKWSAPKLPRHEESQNGQGVLCVSSEIEWNWQVKVTITRCHKEASTCCISVCNPHFWLTSTYFCQLRLHLLSGSDLTPFWDVLVQHRTGYKWGEGRGVSNAQELRKNVKRKEKGYDLGSKNHHLLWVIFSKLIPISKVLVEGGPGGVFFSMSNEQW